MIVDDRQQNMIKTGTNVQCDAALDPALDGAIDGPCHRYPLRVHYEDTDAGGIIYHTQYLGFVVRRIEIDFLLPSGLGTILEVESSLLRLGGASLKLQQNIMNRENGHILARLVVDIGLVEFRNGNPPKICRLPAAIKNKFSGLMT